MVLPDIVVVVDGGVVTDVYGPLESKVMLLDMDNIRHHPGFEIIVEPVNGTPDSIDCQSAIKDAMDIIAKRAE
jgi:hypothetical protein